MANHNGLLDTISKLIEDAKRSTFRQVNTINVQIYREIGRLIVEEEQRGEERAAYGTALVVELSKDLSQRYGKGFSKSNLFLMKKFYITYPPEKFQTVSGKFAREQVLSWSHYCELISLRDDAVRSFCEIESIKNNWSVRELKREIDSLLFERLALSKDKHQIMQLARNGHVIEKPEDAVKDPYILEFRFTGAMMTEMI